MQTAQNFINNEWIAGSTKFEVSSPLDGKLIGNCEFGDDLVNDAVVSSQKAFETWSKRTVKDRIQYLFRFHALVQENKDKLASIIMLEHGKTRQEALAEIAKGNETVEYAISLPQLISGNIQQVSRGVTCMDLRKPHGVTCSIVPFNFPFMVPMWTLPIAIAAGNTFILKPSEKVPLTMSFTMELIKKAGFPPGVVNLVHGTKNLVEKLCDHPLVKAVTFVGTSMVAELLSKRCRNLGKRVLALGGAKNHLIAAPDCDLQMASTDIVNSFVGCAGQRCMAASVLLVLGDQPKLLELLVEKASQFTPGQESQQMGPVIDQQSLQKIIKYINDSETGGAEILLDGRKWLSDSISGTGGNWIGPTIILHKNKNDKALHDEIFGPVISVFQVKTKEEAIEIENACPYGNAACIYTTSGAVADWFTERFSAGMMGVNIGVPVPREPFSFGGINNSKFGDFDITGDGGLEFYTHRRKITTKWMPPKEANWMS